MSGLTGSTAQRTSQMLGLEAPVALVQLGGLEPPTSCSTDRRSNQLSYNCIARAGPKKGVPNGRETRCNARLWQAARHPIVVVSKVPRRSPPQQKARALAQAFRKEQKAGRSGRRLVILRRGDLDRLNRLGRDLLAELGEFLGLRGQDFELLAGVRGPQLQRLGGRLHAEQLLREVERGGGVGLYE